MKLNLEEMNCINKIQLDIYKSFKIVCDELKLKYFFVHGSLLGAIRHEGFFPFDDDIDIAMPRKDYDILIEKGQELLPPELFIQSCVSEPKYPLPFAKIRNSNTAFIQPMLKGLGVNMGMYIDIFPLDFFPDHFVKRAFYKVKERFYSVRISAEMNKGKNNSMIKRGVFALSRIIMPSYERTVQKRAFIYRKISHSSLVIVNGGKLKEQGIPLIWFGDVCFMKFEGEVVPCPMRYDEYLKSIYGDYYTYDPSEKYLDGCGMVEISADYVSVSESYLKQL